MFKVCVVCSDQSVLEDLSRMVSQTGDVTILQPFTSIPTEVVLDRYLRIRAPHAILISGSGGSHTIDFIEHIRRTYPNLQVGMLCADRDPEALVSFMRAGVRYKENDYAGAIDDYTKVIELDPKDMNAHSNRGDVYHNRKEYDKAITDYSKVIEIDPNFVLGYINRAHSRNLSGDYNGAIEDYKKALQIHPDEGRYIELADMQTLNKDFGGAAATFTTLIELNPNDASLYRKRAAALRAMKNTRRANADIKKAVRLEKTP